MSPEAEEPKPKTRQRKPGLIAVAKAVGVSHATVSNAYNRPDQLSEALRLKILEAAAALGYPGPDPVARKLRHGRASALAVVFPERLPYPFDDAAAIQVLRGIAETLVNEEMALVLVPGSPDTDTPGAGLRNVAVDGLIIHSLAVDDPLLQVALARRLPTVTIDGPVMDELDFVGVDDRAAARKATQHLLDLGHRKIGVLTFRLSAHTHPGPVSPDRAAAATGIVGRHRVQGCMDAIEAAGLAWDDIAVHECISTGVEFGREGTHALLDRNPDITALFAFSDAMALGAKLAAAERGIAIPEQLSLVGFDDSAPESEQLTTVRQPQRDKGRIAAERLISTLKTGPHPPTSMLLRTELILRTSTAPPREP